MFYKTSNFVKIALENQKLPIFSPKKFCPPQCKNLAKEEQMLLWIDEVMNTWDQNCK
jgi:hypothetical protein